MGIKILIKTMMVFLVLMIAISLGHAAEVPFIPTGDMWGMETYDIINFSNIVNPGTITGFFSSTPCAAGTAMTQVYANGSYNCVSNAASANVTGSQFIWISSIDGSINLNTTETDIRYYNKTEANATFIKQSATSIGTMGVTTFLGNLINVTMGYFTNLVASESINATNFYQDGYAVLDSRNGTGSTTNITLLFNPILGFTSSEYNGSFTNNSLIGYTAANDICDSDYSGSHFCLKSEVLKSIANGYYSFNGTGWFQNGPPGYTANANDCDGWTTDSNTYLGPFWNWDSNAQAGTAALTNCAQSKKLMCCGGSN